LLQLIFIQLFLADTVEGIDLWVRRFGCKPERLARQLRKGQYNTKLFSELEARANWLQHRLDLTEEQMKKLFKRMPVLLAYSIEDNIEPKLRYFQSRLALNEVNLRSIITQMPTLLGLSVEKNIEPKLKYLQTRLELNDSKLRGIIKKMPMLLAYSIENNIEPTV